MFESFYITKKIDKNYSARIIIINCTWFLEYISAS